MRGITCLYTNIYYLQQIVRGINNDKKGMIAALVFMLMFALVGCGSSTEKTATTEKKITVVTDAAFAPFEYMDKGEIVGFDVDLLKAVMKEAGLEYELKTSAGIHCLRLFKGKQRIWPFQELQLTMIGKNI